MFKWVLLSPTWLLAENCQGQVLRCHLLWFPLGFWGRPGWGRKAELEISLICMLSSKIDNTVSKKKKKKSFGTNLRETIHAVEDMESLQIIDLKGWCSFLWTWNIIQLKFLHLNTDCTGQHYYFIGKYKDIETYLWEKTKVISSPNYAP